MRQETGGQSRGTSRLSEEDLGCSICARHKCLIVRKGGGVYQGLEGEGDEGGSATGKTDGMYCI